MKKRSMSIFICMVLLVNTLCLNAFAMPDTNLQMETPYVSGYTSSSNAIELNDVVDVTIDVIDPNLTQEVKTSDGTITMQEDSNFQNDSSDNTFLESTIFYDDSKSGAEFHLVLNHLTYVGEGHQIKVFYQIGNYQNTIAVDVMETMHTADLEDAPSYQLQSEAYVQADARVKDAQVWLNQTYTGKPGYTPIPENGVPGTVTSEAFVEGLQIELGMSNVTGTFGDQTKAAFDSQVGALSVGSSDSDNHFVQLLQHALFCKGYSPTQVTGNFLDGTANAVLAVKHDAGFSTSDPTVDSMWYQAILNSDAYVLISGGDPKIREMQQDLNRKYNAYCGIMPCDGWYSRDTNAALIYGWQAEEGLDTETANGNFGPTTTSLSPALPYDSRYSSQSLSNFTILTKYSLYCNEVNGSDQLVFDGNYDGTTTQVVKTFQQFMCLPRQDGNIDVGTTMSLLTRNGDPNRSAAGCDCSAKLNASTAASLYNDGYRYVGRYLTNVPGGRDKMMDLNEYRTISDAGLRVFPIFQQGNENKDHFSYEQGKIDCDLAVQAAEKLFLPQSATIYFAVDYDFMNSEVTNQVIPYFEGVNDQMKSGGYSSKYQIGVYGARNICTRVSNEGLAVYSFVNDMSTSYSGNCGYPMPTNWSFDQFNKYTCSAKFGLDKDAVSGRDQGCSLDTSYHGATYDRDAAKDYMKMYAKDPNNSYIKYSADCANFVSQCLVAGGIPQNSAWYYGGCKMHLEYASNEELDAAKADMDVGEPWRKAHTQYEYFSNPANGYINGDVVTITSASDIPSVLAQCEAEGKPVQVGDIMYFTPNGEGGDGTHHAAIISTVHSQEIKYAAHTQERFDETLGDRQLKNEDICIIRLRDQNG